MTNQVLSPEQMQELVELGIDTSKASAFYNKDKYIHFSIQGNEINPSHWDSIVDKEGYTRILLIIPQENKEVIMDYDHTVQFYGKWLDTAFNMLKWCKQNNYI